MRRDDLCIPHNRKCQRGDRFSGQTVSALTPIDSHGGRIFVEGEYWNAISDTPVEQGEPVEIAAVQGLTLRVKSKGEQSDAINRRTI